MDTNTLFESITKRDVTFRNKVAMCALTRCRAEQDGTPNESLVKYYTERAADAAFVLAEATAVSQRGHAFPSAACMFTDSHEQGWAKVVDSVHSVEGKIYLQLYHAGRSTPKEFLNGELPFAPSAIKNRHAPKAGEVVLNYDVPKEMTQEDIDQVKKEFVEAAQRAKRAGFDGVQLHAANGYLIDNFLRSASNTRTDKYGGSAENRSRFLLELVDEVSKVYAPNQIGVKVSPVGAFNDMNDANPEETFSYLFNQLDERGILFLEVMEPGLIVKETFHYDLYEEKQMPNVAEVLRKHFTNGIYVANNKLTPEVAKEMVDSKLADMVSFGKLYIPNPDLTFRLKNGYELNAPDYPTFIGPFGDKGYNDYPKYKN